jgi:hypothetical protein
MDSLSGPDLVKHIQQMNPGASIEEVLDQTRTISLKRILVQIQKIEYATPMDLLEDLCDFQLTIEDVKTIMEWYGGDAKILSESRSFLIIHTYMSSKSKTPWCCWVRG